MYCEGARSANFKLTSARTHYSDTSDDLDSSGDSGERWWAAIRSSSGQWWAHSSRRVGTLVYLYLYLYLYLYFYLCFHMYLYLYLCAAIRSSGQWWAQTSRRVGTLAL